jgi:hypothetical protein
LHLIFDKMLNFLHVGIDHLYFWEPSNSFSIYIYLCHWY